MMNDYSDIYNEKVIRYFSPYPKWSLFQIYLDQKTKGLRKEALHTLDEFLMQYKKWNDADQKEFVLAIVSFIDKNGKGFNSFFITPLMIIVKEFMKEWVKTETKNSLPFRWLAQEKGDLELARKALSINSKDDLARLVIINSYLDKIWWSTHSLPSHFNGDVDEIRAIYPVCLHEIELLVDAEIQLKFRDELEEEIQVVNDFQKSQK